MSILYSTFKCSDWDERIEHIGSNCTANIGIPHKFQFNHKPKRNKSAYDVLAKYYDEYYTWLKGIFNNKDAVMAEIQRAKIMHTRMRLLEFLYNESKNGKSNPYYTIQELHDMGVLDLITESAIFSTSNIPSKSLNDILTEYDKLEEEMNSELNINNLLYNIRIKNYDMIIKNKDNITPEEYVMLYINNHKYNIMINKYDTQSAWLYDKLINKLQLTNKNDEGVVVNTIDMDILTKFLSQLDQSSIWWLLDDTSLVNVNNSMWTDVVKKYMSGFVVPNKCKYPAYEFSIMQQINILKTNNNYTDDSAVYNRLKVIINEVITDLIGEFSEITETLLKDKYIIPTLELDDKISLEGYMIQGNAYNEYVLRDVLWGFMAQSKFRTSGSISIKDQDKYAELKRLNPNQKHRLQEIFRRAAKKYMTEDKYNEMVKNGDKYKFTHRAYTINKPKKKTTIHKLYEYPDDIEVPKFRDKKLTPDQLLMYYLQGSDKEDELLKTNKPNSGIISIEQDIEINPYADLWKLYEDILGIMPEHILSMNSMIFIDVYSILKGIPDYSGTGFFDNMLGILGDIIFGFNNTSDKPTLEYPSFIKSLDKNIIDTKPIIVRDAFNGPYVVGQTLNKFEASIFSKQFVGDDIDVDVARSDGLLSLGMRISKNAIMNSEDIQRNSDMYDKFLNSDVYNKDAESEFMKDQFVEEYRRNLTTDTFMSDLLGRMSNSGIMYPNEKLTLSKYQPFRSKDNNYIFDIRDNSPYSDYSGQILQYENYAKYRRDYNRKLKRLYYNRQINNYLGITPANIGYVDLFKKKVTNLSNNALNFAVDSFKGSPFDDAAKVVSTIGDTAINAIDGSLNAFQRRLNNTTAYIDGVGKTIGSNVDSMVKSVAPFTSALSSISTSVLGESNGISESLNSVSNISKGGLSSVIDNIFGGENGKGKDIPVHLLSKLKNSIEYIKINGKKLSTFIIDSYVEEADYVEGDMVKRYLKLRIFPHDYSIIDNIPSKGSPIELRRIYTLTHVEEDDIRKNYTPDRDIIDLYNWNWFDEVSTNYVVRVIKKTAPPKDWKDDYTTLAGDNNSQLIDDKDKPMLPIELEILPIIRSKDSEVNVDNKPMVSYVPVTEVLAAKMGANKVLKNKSKLDKFIDNVTKIDKDSLADKFIKDPKKALSVDNVVPLIHQSKSVYDKAKNMYNAIDKGLTNLSNLAYNVYNDISDQIKPLGYTYVDPQGKTHYINCPNRPVIPGLLSNILDEFSGSVVSSYNNIITAVNDTGLPNMFTNSDNAGFTSGLEPFKGNTKTSAPVPNTATYAITTITDTGDASLGYVGRVPNNSKGIPISETTASMSTYSLF